VETKKMMLIFADRGIQSGWSADSIQSTLEGIEEKFEKCNDKLASVSVGPCSYQFQADKIERMTQDLQLLQSYASSAPDYVWETLDNPLYVDFKNNATESLSQIILDDFYTDNTIGMEEHFTVSQKGAVYSQKRVKETLTFSDFFGLPAVEHEDSMVTLENVETVNEFASLFRKDYDKMKEADIETCIRNYLTSGEFNHEAYHPARDFLSGLLDITIVKPVIEFFTGTDLITGERLTEAQKYQKMAGAIVDMFTFGQGLVAMKGAGLVGKELCKAFGKTMLVEVASSASAYTVGYGVEAMGLPPQIAWMLGAATGCIVSTAGMNLVFRNPQTGVVRECSLEEITSLEKLDASEIDITKLGKEVPTDDLELYMRYQKEGSIEHFTDSEKKTISRIETMGIKGDECEEILRARGKEVTRPPIEEPEAVLPPRNESEGKGGSDVIDNIITDGSHLDNGKLKPNVTYKTGEHDYIYKTNEDGLIVKASTDNLQLKTHEGRLKHNPNTYGKETGDHAGHLFGDRFGGSPELDNLVSQAKNVNVSEFKVIENQWAKALENGQKVTVGININYDAGNIRPISFDVSYTIEGIHYYQKIYN
jgi:hypothetical protein